MYYAINTGISKTITNGLYYDDIIDINYDPAGNVSTIKSNIYNMNLIASRLQEATENLLKKSKYNSISIKLGAFTGISFFSGFGPDLKINIDDVDFVNCEFISNFSSEGINQTLHSIYININAECGIVLPFRNIKIKKYQQFILCETIIVGKIPEVYLFSDNLDSLYNFVPVN